MHLRELKACGIVGFKKSGKTTLGVALAQELTRMGHRVGVIKHVSHDLDLAPGDTVRYHQEAASVGGVSAASTEILLKGPRTVNELLPWLAADVLLVEGFKTERTYPKILCLRNPEERGQLADGLELCTASLKAGLGDFAIGNPEHVRRMAEMILARGFKLPDLNCEHCGYASCFDLARAIVGGEAQTEACKTLESQVRLRVGGTDLPLNPFVSNFLRNAIQGMMKSLKNAGSGRIELVIEP